MSQTKGRKMFHRKAKILVADFETTVYKDQKNTEVWASACVELFTEDVKIFHSIQEQFDYLVSLDTNVIVYFHNLKFDGSFWLSYLLCDLKLEQAYEKINDTIVWQKEKFMKNKTFKYSISDRGQWYTITIKYNNHYIIIRDSLKLLPFSVGRIGKSFGTKHKKLDMEYKGFRYAGCEITPEEQKYIANDVLVVKEALEIMFSENHKELTIGSCCLKEYKRILKTQTAYDYDELFPNLYNFELKDNTYQTAGEYIRKSYRGGWCYLVKGKEGRLFTDGTTADVNSLYPSVMHSMSGNKYPVGLPMFWTGNYIPDDAIGDDKYFFVRIKTRFYLKPGFLPFIQIKNNLLYKGTECLETSDIWDDENNMYITSYKDKHGKVHDTRVEMTLTMTDYKLILEHYELVDFEIIDGCWFYAMVGLFDAYINKYAEIKMRSEGALRELAKLFLNNLYGKFASSTNSSFKFAIVKEDGVIGFIPQSENDKTPGYIPVGTAVTSYARNFTIRAAQKNYHGKDCPGFIYADTDSIHCDLAPEDIVGIEVDDKRFCCWKLESCWDIAIFARQKTYIEHIVKENLKPIDTPYNNIKCAGMPNKCKDLLNTSLEGTQTDIEDYTEDERKFLFDDKGKKIRRSYSDFRRGLLVPGKLLPKRIPGGIILKDTTYEMR